jgi:hypothetical protein
MSDINAMEYYRAIRRNEILILLQYKWTWKYYAKWKKLDKKPHII